MFHSLCRAALIGILLLGSSAEAAKKDAEIQVILPRFAKRVEITSAFDPARLNYSIVVDGTEIATKQGAAAHLVAVLYQDLYDVIVYSEGQGGTRTILTYHVLTIGRLGVDKVKDLPTGDGTLSLKTDVSNSIVDFDLGKDVSTGKSVQARLKGNLVKPSSK